MRFLPLVLVLMMHVRDVRVPVLQPRVPMVVGVRLAGWITRRVRMPVMLVVHMRVCMFHRLVPMLMLVMLGEMQPYADGHQETSCEQLDCQRLLQERQCGNRSQKWRAVEK